jgi:hypothetical protein
MEKRGIHIRFPDRGAYVNENYLVNRMKHLTYLVIIGIVAACLPMAVCAADIGGDEGWYTVYCNVNGASVYFDGTYKGMIANGELSVAVYTTGTPYSSFSVEADGYETYTGSITDVPSAGETVSLYATLTPVPPTTTIGGDEGWYTVHCNVDGASVYFDGTYKGMIASGELSVAVYTTGTPYTSYSVEADGYETYTGSINTVPSAGETVDLYATLNPVPPAPPIGGDKGWYAVHCNVDGASVYFDDEYKGAISNGVLNVEVYVTGTPYTQYTVEKEGYQTFTSSIDQYPGKGQTVDLYATLDPLPPVTTESPLSPAIACVALGILGLLCCIFRKP